MMKDPAENADQTSLEAMLKNLVNAEKQTNRMILIGAPRWVEQVIHQLHAARITEVRDWPRPMRTRNPDEVISLMQRPKVED